MPEAPLASVIVVSRDLPASLHATLASLRAQTLPELETVVVLNRADDARRDPEWAAELAEAEVVVAGRNLGFAAGVNLGVRASRGRYVLLLNDDAWADPVWAERLVGEAESDPRVGSCAADVLLVDPPGRIDTTGHLLFADGLNRGRGRLEIDRGQYDSRRDALFPSGAAALYRRELLEAPGGFESRFFAYGEDTELGLRARLAGWECRFVPGARAWHHGSATAGAYSAFKAYQVERNRVWLVARHFPLFLVLLNPWVAGARHLVQAIGIARGRGAAARFHDGTRGRGLLATAIRALVDGWLGVPGMVLTRLRGRSARRRSPRAVYRWLRVHGLGLREVAWTE
ncbi:MAG: glycosyltransferase family 2 protein [Deltaproteobacteria bacterium]|nr:glycosyltransferase family 2 protein [Deltaproteobacteria bacterium]